MPKRELERQPQGLSAETSTEKPPIPSGARPIVEAPETGETVWLYNEQITHGIRGFWRKSRHYQKGAWRVNNYWADPTTRKPLAATWTHWMSL